MIAAAPVARCALAHQADVQSDHGAALLGHHLGAHLVGHAGGDEQLDVDVLAGLGPHDRDLRIGKPLGCSGIRRGLDDLDRGDLLVEQEARDVDLVDQRIPHHHRAVEDRRDGRVAVRAVHHQRLAELTAVDQCLQLGVLVVEPAHEPDLDQLLAEFGLPLDHGERGFHVGGQRLLAQHRLAVLQAGQQLLLVRRTRRGQHDGVDVGIGDGVQRVADRAAPGTDRGDLLGLLGEVVVDHDDPGACDRFGDAGDVVGAHHADAEDGYAKIRHVSFLTCTSEFHGRDTARAEVLAGALGDGQGCVDLTGVHVLLDDREDVDAESVDGGQQRRHVGDSAAAARSSRRA